MPGPFLDTKVVLYAFSQDAAKAARAELLLEQGGTISVQVLNEAANVARRKMSLSWAETRLLSESLKSLFSVVPVTLEMHQTGLALAERHGFSVYDSMIVAAALLAKCDLLLSEDMQDGREIEGRLRIVNPFAGLTGETGRHKASGASLGALP